MSVIRVEFQGQSFQIVNPCLHNTQLHVYCPVHPLWEAMAYAADKMVYVCTARKPSPCSIQIPLSAIMGELQHWQIRLERIEKS